MGLTGNETYEELMSLKKVLECEIDKITDFLTEDREEPPKMVNLKEKRLYKTINQIKAKILKNEGILRRFHVEELLRFMNCNQEFNRKEKILAVYELIKFCKDYDVDEIKLNNGYEDF